VNTSISMSLILKAIHACSIENLRALVQGTDTATYFAMTINYGLKYIITLALAGFCLWLLSNNTGKNEYKIVNYMNLSFNVADVEGSVKLTDLLALTSLDEPFLILLTLFTF
jgi:hypothetical protein